MSDPASHAPGRTSLQPEIRRRDADEPLTNAQSSQQLLRLLYARRGVIDEIVTPGLESLAPAAALYDIDAAVEAIGAKLRAGGHLLIVGDYDADGATGSALAVRGLRALGAARVSYLIPSRFADGYGLGVRVAEAGVALKPDLMITVDNGISSIAGVERAAALGVPVVVTDHHLPGAYLPAAAAIVNPNQPECRFPSKHLAGVGVIFYVLAALRARLRSDGWFSPARPEPNLAELLDLVALGTVADVAPLDRNNRILVEQGLRRIRADYCRPGIQALLTVANRDRARINATDLAFAVAPRLNAAGRLEDMSLGVECLLTDDPSQAQALAQQLDALNRQRRQIESEMKEQAEQALDALILDGEHLPAGLCLFGADWHHGVSGIVAARIRERYHRPTIAFAPADDGSLRGSARSIEGLHIRDALAWIDCTEPGLITRFGGHAMAAGLSLAADDLKRFGILFDRAVRQQLGDRPLQPIMYSDGELPARLLTLEVAETLRLAGPWGKDFPEPLFDGVFEVNEARVVGERHLKLRLTHPDGAMIEAIGFHLAERLPDAQGEIRLVYRLDVNDYQGRRSPQLVLEAIQATP